MSDLTSEQISRLADKWLKGTISQEEKALFEAWYNSVPEGTVEWHDETAHSSRELREQLLQQIRDRMEEKRPLTLYKRIPVRYLGAAAAVIVLMIATGIYWYTVRKDQPSSIANNKEAAARLKPGGNKATLTLANGAVITLEDEQNGALGQQNNTKIIKLNNGQLVYNSEQGKAGSTPAVLNTLSVPRGGKYNITLADGTVVWLNAASSMTFPAAFTGRERQVTLNGEAYFEVAADASRPFIVKVGDMHIRVLGTHFNVMAYNDEQSVNTTLLQGAVKVQSAGGEALLKPGQQAKMDHTGNLKVVRADIDAAIAWKNGLFSFNNASIEEVMREVARWFDAEIVYPDGIPQDRFQGEIDRNSDITAVLKILEASGVKFTVQGHKIMVRS
ncbi:FecR domain-containing protein [Chitinophaga filiformis]|uniref:FecR family protein n=1 Tax=Chitinophaga filiformis TaxID=104663 RepID=UPI001F2A43D9|nr:FecR family protein [Chitinophaga filiformis]MCF6405518.1 FecR domain-containing protein [Chitinophaga filiformis]